MSKYSLILCVGFVFTQIGIHQSFAEDTRIRIPRNPAISPDGKQIAFDWQNDVWLAGIDGGNASRLTIHAATDVEPHFSSDGEHIYFSSNRTGSTQIYVMPVQGGAARQLSFDSNRKKILGVTSDGRYLLVSQTTDRGWHYSEYGRLFLFDTHNEQPKRMLFDAGIRDAAISPDGSKVLFVRGRSNWNRKGYKGPQAAQLWLADLSEEPPKLTRLSKDRKHFQNIAVMDPMWSEDGTKYYFNSDPEGVFNIYEGTLESDEVQQITDIREDGNDDGIAFPVLSRDGGTFLLRRGFDLFTCTPDDGEIHEIVLTASGDNVTSPIERRLLKSSADIAFTSDGKQMAFVAGEDIYVMDRILKEPVRITHNDNPEGNLLFSTDDSRLFFTSDSGGEVDIWEATHQEEDGIWWRAKDFKLRQVTNDRHVENRLALSPKGEKIAYSKGSNLFVMDDDGTDQRQIVKMWSSASFSWSPDGKWLTYATQDDDYNSDIFIVSIDGTRDPFNLSRHPDSDYSPVWSGDGQRIAWIGRRDGDESDIYVVNLNKASVEKTDRDERLEKAIAAAKKSKPKQTEEKEDETEKNSKVDSNKAKDDGLDIDFEDISDRIQRLRYADTTESDLIWIDDGATLAFSAEISGERAFYSVKFPRPAKPNKIAQSPLSSDHWLKGSKQFVGMRDRIPASMSTSGKVEKFEFEVRAERDWREVRKITFDQAWRAMRDRFYDPAFNNKNWNTIRTKYRPVAAESLGSAEFSELMNMMLGELNASHMGHRGGTDPLPDFDAQNDWTPTTYHLGLRFAFDQDGPGLKVESVIPGSPCSRARSLIKAGETLLNVDGLKVGPKVDIEKLLTMAKVRDMVLKVRSTEGEERTVTVRPTISVSHLLYDEWVEKTRSQVEELSDGKLGYLHIQGMNFTSFRKMEEDIYHAGIGKNGLIIDVRFNGGGSTTDHVMTALTQPIHAITQSRGSGEGYPQDRRVYAAWTKPIVLMCNEHSFSNAEILSHAIKQTGRGRLVGMRTAGGVISTGSVGLLDGGYVRMPMRGWYLATTGEDMELNGCEPHVVLWNEPSWNSPGGVDLQLGKAVETLKADVKKAKSKKKVKIVPASKLRK